MSNAPLEKGTVLRVATPSSRSCLFNPTNPPRIAQGDEMGSNSIMYLWMWLLIAPAALVLVDRMRT